MFALNEGDSIRGDASAATVVDYTLHGIIGTTIRQLADGQLAASEGNLYTATTDGIAVTAICLVNTDSSARTVNLYLKPKGGTSRRVVPKAISLSAGYSMYANGVEIKIVDTSGQEQTSAIALDDTPVDGVVTEGITSNWAYDHNAAKTAVHAAGAYDLLNTGDVDDTPVDAATTAPVSSNWAYDTDVRIDALEDNKVLWSPAVINVYDDSASDFVVSSSFYGAELPDTDDRCGVNIVIPDDFNSLAEAKLVILAVDTQASADWDIYTYYGATGQAYNTHSDSDTSSTYSFTADENLEIDIFSLLGSLAAGDYLSVVVINKGGTTHQGIVRGVYIRYSTG